MTHPSHLTRRHLVQAIALGLALSGGSAMAQAWTSKSIGLIVPIPAGGTSGVLGGHILMSFDTTTPVLPHIKVGKLRPLAVTTARRSGALPDVPTMEESGPKAINIGTWFGVLALAATPKDFVERLNAEMVKIIQSPEFKAKMADVGAEPIGNTSPQMAQQIASETERFAKLVKEAKVAIE